MAITGKLLIDGQWQDGAAGTYQACNPTTGEFIQPEMSKATTEQVNLAVAAATSAASEFSSTTLKARAEFLNTCADEIMALGDELIDRVIAETGYPRARGEGERGRTCGQLRMFAEHILKGTWLDARIDTALPDRAPIPRPDIRCLNQAVGPVVVFGASNFPLAFSVAGGDAASALAAGCPVLVKGHSSHPGTSELVAQAMATAVRKCGLPAGVFSLLMGSGRKVGAALVSAPGVKSVGFTGSYAGGMALVGIANARPEPIPVFAEMGSINPVVLLPEALELSAETIANDFVGSLTLGTGQFCVNPGLVLAIEGKGLDNFMDAASVAISGIDAAVMLNDRICTAYGEGVSQYQSHADVETVSTGGAVENRAGSYGQTTLMTTSATHFLLNPKIHEEVFGPASLIIKCKNTEELLRVVAALKGQLTATIHCTEDELKQHVELTEALSQRVGRIVINGFPTGVEVCPAMVHGGPFPASTDARFTSVGTAAIARFIRPVCYQNFPEAQLPAALRNSNPLNIPRTLDGDVTRNAVV